MPKIRVFELARELNIPGKDLITRMKAMGFTVKGNFDALDDDQVVQIKAKMLEPVTRVEEGAAAAEEGAAGEQPRKRRIISARRSEEVHKIQESLGISGPLPEDAKTREQVEPLPPKAPEPEPVPAAPSVEPAPLAAAAAAAAPLPAEIPVSAPAALAAQPVTAPEPPREPLLWKDVRKVEAQKAAEAAAAAPPAATPVADERAKWREFKRPEKRAHVTPEAEDWVRSPRRRLHARRAPRVPKLVPEQAAPVRRRKIRLGSSITVSEMAGAIGVKASEIIKKLMQLGVIATINQSIEGTVAELIAAEFNVEVEAASADMEELVREEEAKPEDLLPRPPIVTVMGHVDHGKTSLLDRIRASDVAAGEAGGITQHIGAYHVKAPSGDLVFLDTPGHEAFTSLRARGANVTDLVVLVVAADDGVMPQTVEAIQHAKAAQVPILVAVNKIDRPNADVDRVKRQLMEQQLVPEEFGGDTIFVPLSAKTGQGVPQLLEMIQLQAEVLELKAPQVGSARGSVIEARMDRRRGPVATVMVQRGTLAVGDHFVVGHTYGRVRAMFDDRGQVVERATPSIPVEILGFDELPQAGDPFVVMADEKRARELAAHRATLHKGIEAAPPRRAHLEDFLQGAAAGEVVTLNVVLKADTQGSLEALRGSLEKLSGRKANINLTRTGIGGISESDISLASTTNAIVIGFNVRPEAKAQELAHQEGIDVKQYSIIYELIDDVRAALQGLLKPVIREQVIGHLEVRGVFPSPKDGQIVGGYVTDGKLQRNSFFRLYRDNVVVHTGSIGSLRRFKEDVSEVQQGFECGLRILNYTDVRSGDVIEAFIKVEEKQTLDAVGQA
jgi:translation initiation factor IF-2